MSRRIEKIEQDEGVIALHDDSMGEIARLTPTLKGPNADGEDTGDVAYWEMELNPGIPALRGIQPTRAAMSLDAAIERARYIAQLWEDQDFETG